MGRRTQRPSCFDVAAGSYRLLARGVAPTTVSQPWSDYHGWLVASHSPNRAYHRAQSAQQPTKLITPARLTGEGVDKFAAITSAAPPLNTVLVGLFDEVSLESARHALHTTYAHEVDTFSLNDGRNEDEKLTALIQKNRTPYSLPAAQMAARRRDCCAWWTPWN
ncbi:MAG: glutamate mutase L [Chloroflexi bacterium]|nr:glutamate mutase L [Chloroflexota bacterium]